mmetsp:Transcript_116922/g.261240  ORF Transcript_116922/g.261240 Transcript_116922/m.261240 type:complete len:477 (-) Transcript_116922:177-1607(-)
MCEVVTVLRAHRYRSPGVFLPDGDFLVGLFHWQRLVKKLPEHVEVSLQVLGALHVLIDTLATHEGDGHRGVAPTVEDLCVLALDLEGALARCEPLAQAFCRDLRLCSRLDEHVPIRQGASLREVVPCNGLVEPLSHGRRMFTLHLHEETEGIHGVAHGLAVDKLQASLGSLVAEAEHGVRRLSLPSELLGMLLCVGLHLVGPNARRLLLAPGTNSQGLTILGIILAQRLVDPWELGPQEEWNPRQCEVNRLVCQCLHCTRQPAVLDPPMGSGEIRKHANVGSNALPALRFVRPPVRLLTLARAIHYRLASAALQRLIARLGAATSTSPRRSRWACRLPLLPPHLENLLQLLRSCLVSLRPDLGDEGLNLRRRPCSLGLGCATTPGRWCLRQRSCARGHGCLKMSLRLSGRLNGSLSGWQSGRRCWSRRLCRRRPCRHRLCGRRLCRRWLCCHRCSRLLLLAKGVGAEWCKCRWRLR